MKKVLAMLAAIALASGSAFAADLPTRPAPVYKAPAAVPSAYTWSGCYIDGGGGYGLWNQDHYGETDPGFIRTTVTTTTGGRGWYGTVGGGCDYQVGPFLGGNIVIGVLADYNFMNLHGDFQEPISGLVGTEKENSAWAAGGRVGYAWGPTILTYVSGGYTEARFGSFGLTSNAGVPTIFSFPAQTYHGWFLGGGTDTSLAALLPGLPSGLFLRNEYRYSSYQAADVPILPVGNTGSANNMKKQVQTITTALVWKFNWR